MRMLNLIILITTVSLITMGSLALADSITIAKSIPFSEFSGATHSVINKCKFETRLPAYIKSAAKKKVDIVLSTKPLEEVLGKVLFLEIINVHAPGGGGYSGSKSATISGELKENGEVIGSVTVRRRTLIGMMPGTCSMLKRIAKKIGSDIAGWLVEPTKEARLGDLKDE